jgi:phosphocarrier protein HPr
VSAEAPRRRTVTVVNRLGLHARAAARFVRCARGFTATVTVTRDDMAVGGLSIMGLMMLGATCGTPIDISAHGPDAAEALDALVALVDSGFGEND